MSSQADLSGPAAVAGNEMALLVARDYLQQMTVELVVPQPADQVVDGPWVCLTIPVTDPGEAVAVQLTLTPDQVGRPQVPPLDVAVRLPHVARPGDAARAS